MDLTTIKNTVFRWSFLTVLLIVSVLIGFAPDVSIGTGLTIIAFEAIALFLVYIVLYVFSPINFIEELKYAFLSDKPREYISTAIVCSVFISVHVLVGLVVWGVYFTNYRPIP